MALNDRRPGPGCSSLNPPSAKTETENTCCSLSTTWSNDALSPPAIADGAGSVLRKMQTGRVQQYAASFVAGALILVVVFVFVLSLQLTQRLKSRESLEAEDLAAPETVDRLVDGAHAAVLDELRHGSGLLDGYFDCSHEVRPSLD